jgi:ubiquinone/menaquinone biosynthesis C-methylase UbiE
MAAGVMIEQTKVDDSQTAGERRDFWTTYQPGFRFTTERVGTPEFFAAVERHRYKLEPAIRELVRFEECAGLSVLEAGCGIATDGINFARAGATYTGVDFSPAAVELARRRFALENRSAQIIHGSITELPVGDETQDFVYSNGVIHHLPETERVVAEMYRVLRPGGRALVMVYHRGSLNYHVNIMLIRRALTLGLLLPGFGRLVTRLTGENPDVLNGHRGLLREHGLRYLNDSQLFLSNNTDGPGNPLSKVYSREDAQQLFGAFAEVRTSVRFLNLRLYPYGEKLAETPLARMLERRFGWHLWIEAIK